MPNVLTRSTREIPEDAPLHSLPPEEATPLQQLKHSAVPLLQSPRSPLPIEDPWSSFSQEDNHTLRDEMLLRFLRYNALNPNKALKQLENVLDWRAKSQIGTTVPDVMHGLPAGVPIVQLTDATEQGDALFFAAAEQYQKKAVDHKIQQVAVARLFEHMLYEKTGPRLKRGCVVVDFTGFGVRHVDMHGLHAGVVTYLSYYPDVFAKILLLNYPKLLYGSKLYIASYQSPS